MHIFDRRLSISNTLNVHLPCAGGVRFTIATFTLNWLYTDLLIYQFNPLLHGRFFRRILHGEERCTLTPPPSPHKQPMLKMVSNDFSIYSKATEIFQGVQNKSLGSKISPGGSKQFQGSQISPRSPKNFRFVAYGQFVLVFSNN